MEGLFVFEAQDGVEAFAGVDDEGHAVLSVPCECVPRVEVSVFVFCVVEEVGGSGGCV